ncbi:uncharacterized protein CDAR_203401 [Caerostris darwini]|uniref:Reverse transcriptase domain-containing protein n=1 Tax=Caerostris darwini TaxID=1538125 RepID=A0AAV4QAC7_9ARAC|nr:hypothetical protein CDAR_203121 [Caerostris darwini]GIY05322.1 uncharacterized protein CDAR_203401 [Caerostris darwini]
MPNGRQGHKQKTGRRKLQPQRLFAVHPEAIGIDSQPLRFGIIKQMNDDENKTELSKLKVWKNGIAFKIYSVYCSLTTNLTSVYHLYSLTQYLLMILMPILPNGGSIILSKRRCYDNFISNINFQRDSLNTYKFLSCLKNQTPQTAKRPFSINRKIISSDAKVAGYFLKYFTEANRKGAYARKISRLLKCQLGHRRDRSEDLPERVKSIFCSPFTMHELNMVLNGLKNRKSPGVNNIHPEFLKHLGQTAKANLLKFFNIIWTTGCVPSLWRKAIIIPIHKKDKNPEEISNYRPISLTSLMSKTIERMAK